MTTFLSIPKHIFEEMIAHCRAGYPNEACGILAGRDNAISGLYKMTNAEQSPVSYCMDTSEQFRVMKDLREKSLSMVAIFHSHPSSPANPSGKDIALAFYEDTLHVIVSLIGDEPVAKGFSIREGKIGPVEIRIQEDQ